LSLAPKEGVAYNEYEELAKSIVCSESYAWNCNYAMAVVKCETGGTYWPWVVNNAGPYIGWWQVWDLHVTDPENLVDPAYNTDVAYRLWKSERTFSGHWPFCGRGM